MSADGDNTSSIPAGSDGPADRAGTNDPANAPTAPWSVGAPGSMGMGVGVPQTIGRYRLVRLLGAGGMGAVYLAEQERPSRQVALKIIRGGMMTPDGLKRFEVETEILGRLHHPAIAQVYEAGVQPTDTGPMPWFAMEYVPGGEPIDVHCRGNGLSPAQRIALMERVCDAAQHAHDRGVIHRDLKPDNILVAAEGHPKIIDFGVARVTDSELGPRAARTSAGEVVGTLSYMAPEQLEGEHPRIDERADVYALGAVLYQLLTDRLPHDVEDLSIVEAARRIREEAPLPARRANPELSVDLDSVLTAALRQNPAHRYSSAADLRDDLRRVLAGEPVRPPRISPATYALSWSRAAARRGGPALVIGCAAVALIIAQVLLAPLFFLRSDIGGWVERTLFSGGAPSDLPVDLSRSCVIAISPEVDFAALGSAAGIEGVSTTNLRTLRPLYGMLCERLAEAGPRVVVFDLMFRAPSPEGDAAMARGIRRLRAAGITTLVVNPVWDVDEQGMPELAPALRALVRWGACSGNFNSAEPWCADVVVRRAGAEPMPSLAIAAMARCRLPDAEAAFDINPVDSTVTTQFFRVNPEQPAARAWLGTPIRQRVAEITRITTLRKDDRALGLREGDELARLVLHLPTTQELDRATIRFDIAMHMAPDELRRRVRDKAVFVGKMLDEDDLHPTPDDRRLHGVYANAIAFETLLNDDPIRTPTVAQTWWITTGFAAIGTIIAIAYRRRTVVVTMLAATSLISVIVAVLAFRYSGWLVNPLVPTAAMVLAAVLATMVPIRPAPPPRTATA